jgi:hypothetical protein
MESCKYHGPKSWRLLLNQGAKIVYPAHGDPFPVEVIEKTLAEG